MLLEMHLTADQTMRPVRIDLEAVSQKLKTPSVIGAPQEDHPTVRIGFQIELPVARELASIRSRLDAQSVTLPIGLHIAIRARRERLE